MHRQIARALLAAGHEALMVGGCVRDTFFGREAKDVDLATSAPPHEVARVLRAAGLSAVPVDTASAYPVVVAHGVEVATFRRDTPGAARAEARAISLEGATLEDDAMRRDFTVNALYQRVDGEVLDPTGLGVADAQARVLRFVGDPALRLAEDPLRALRGIRFCASHGLAPEPDTERAIRQALPRVLPLPGERLAQDLVRILRLRGGLAALHRFGFEVLLGPEFPDLWSCDHGPHHQEGSPGRHTELVLEALPSDAADALVWAAAYHDLGKPSTRGVDGFGQATFHGHEDVSVELARPALTRLRLPSRVVEDTCWLVSQHMRAHVIPAMRPSKRAVLFGDRRFPLLSALLRADCLGRHPVNDRAWRETQALYEEWQARPPEGRDLKAAGVDGRLLLSLGMQPGPKVGQALARLEALLHDGASREDLLEEARRLTFS